MGTTVEKLTKILETKEAIRTAINNKGGTLTESDAFSSYSTAIDNIHTGGGENPLQYIIDNRNGDGVASCQYLFYKYKGSNLDNLLNTLDFSKVTSMDGMFSNCTNLTSISGLNNLTAIGNDAFNGCTNLNINNLNLPSLTSLGSGAFYKTGLTGSINLPSLTN